jgi:hypothetical protein
MSAVPPPISAIGLILWAAAEANALRVTKWPKCREAAVGSKPQYVAMSSFPNSAGNAVQSFTRDRLLRNCCKAASLAAIYSLFPLYIQGFSVFIV